MKPTLAELKQIGIANALRCCQLFTGIALVDLRTIAEITSVKPLSKGSYLFHEGDVAVGFYIVQTGAINVHRVNSLGKEHVIHIFRAGESLAEGALATDQGYPADARAVEESQVLLVQKAGFLSLLQRQPELALRMLGSMSSHLRILVAQLEDLTMKNVETRLANWLLKHCPDPAGQQQVKIALTMTKRALAGELGTVSETFSRTLASFRNQKLISVNGRDLTVICPSQLAAILRQHLGE